jgi:hypothetical protein
MNGIHPEDPRRIADTPLLSRVTTKQQKSDSVMQQIFIEELPSDHSRQITVLT